MPKKLLIAADVDRSLHERAAADGRFEIVDRPVRTEEELAAIVGECDVLVTRSFNRVTRHVIERALQLELIAQGTSGTDNIDHAAARERGITVLNLPGTNADAVAEMVIAAMISLTRTIPAYTRELVRGVWNREDCATRHELRHYRFGIVGLGEVGRRVARLAGVFGMRVAAIDPYISDRDFVERGAVRVRSLDELLKSSDIVTLHVPLTPETRRMIGAPQIASMPRGSVLINAARGEVLDQKAALDALQSNHLNGLALDVFDPEPPPHGFPDDPRLILTPHIGGCTHEAKAAIGAKLYEKIVEFYRTR
ncbi:MAG TPA: NAD(P)-dependent oxidoreductase [Thermoanaerobaculia bacterium]|nr:NAD(P)-dependent oxidoreductase [Thermoanaerobaculia bacterium]